MADLRIFSYLPNPRLYKATIAARFSGAEIEIVGAPPKDLLDWLWDYEARELSAEERAEHADCARQARTGFAGTLYVCTLQDADSDDNGAVDAGAGCETVLSMSATNSATI